MDWGLALLLAGLLGLLQPGCAFPDQLTVSPAALVPGDPEVACTAHKVTPVDPNALSFSLLLGDQELEGAQALGPEVEEEEEPQEEEDVLFRVTERWRLPTLAAPVLPALYCQATMRLPGLELSHRQAIPASKPAGDRLPAALWASSAVLGLLLLALSTYHLWKRCQHLAEDGAHPPASLRLLPQVSTWAGLRGTDQVGSSPS
uniref:Mucosal vascular addressin cell adhesion molecule 1 n=1 Tax=Rhinopithecus roxellana TaxID=61622 RepID=A0A2K6N9E4_RHIRO